MERLEGLLSKIKDPGLNTKAGADENRFTLTEQLFASEIDKKNSEGLYVSKPAITCEHSEEEKHDATIRTLKYWFELTINSMKLLKKRRITIMVLSQELRRQLSDLLLIVIPRKEKMIGSTIQEMSLKESSKLETKTSQICISKVFLSMKDIFQALETITCLTLYTKVNKRESKLQSKEEQPQPFKNDGYLTAMIYENPYYSRHDHNRYSSERIQANRDNEFTIYLTLQNSRLKDLKQLHFRPKVNKCRQFTRLGVVEGLQENGTQQNQILPSSLKFTRIPYLTVSECLNPVHKVKNPVDYCKRVRGVQNLDFEAENEKYNQSKGELATVPVPAAKAKSKKADEEDYNKFVF